MFENTSNNNVSQYILADDSKHFDMNLSIYHYEDFEIR